MRPPNLSKLPPEVLQSVVLLQALRKAFDEELDRLWSRLEGLKFGEDPEPVDATDDRLNEEVRRHLRAYQPPEDGDGGLTNQQDFTTELPTPTPAQLERLRKEHQADVNGAAGKPQAPPPGRGRRLVDAYIKANREGGDE